MHSLPGLSFRVDRTRESLQADDLSVLGRTPNRMAGLRQKRPFTQSPYLYGQTIKKPKGHAGITPHGLCETVPLGPPEIPSRGA